MAHGTLAQVGALLGALGSVLVLAAWGRLAVLSGLALLAAAEGMLVVALVPHHDLARLETPLRVAALVVGVLTVAGLAAGFVRWPALAAPALLLAAPFRLPVGLGTQKAFLLLPLYGVLAATGLAFAYCLARGTAARRIARPLAVPAAAYLALNAVSLLWSKDVRQGSIELVFFLFPFAAGVAVVARSPFPEWLAGTLGRIVVGLAALFACVGLWQAATHRIFFAQDLRVANAYSSYFRVTSLFKDPSLYGRFLVLGFAVILVALWLGRLAPVWATLLSTLLWAGLYFSYSQSSMATLVVVVVAVTLVAGDRRTKALVAVFAIVLVTAAAGVVAVNSRHHAARKVTSGRSRLISVTARVIRDHPLVGVGVGAQPLASHEEAAKASSAPRDASHTTPLTVAAELGIPGVLVYLAFLAGAGRILAAAVARDRALGLGLAAVFLALFVHSLVYAGFFEDPITWGALAVAAALLASPRVKPAEHTVGADAAPPRGGHPAAVPAKP